MIKDRERFLGVPSRSGKKCKLNKELAGANCSGNASLQLAWNTTGFLPTTINAVGQKNSVKDFEYLKFLNETILKDEVLEKFMQKAGEIEQAAGPQKGTASPKKKKSELTPLERIHTIKSEFKKDPSKFHTCKNFDALL